MEQRLRGAATRAIGAAAICLALAVTSTASVGATTVAAPAVPAALRTPTSPAAPYVVGSACKRDTGADNRYVLYAYNVLLRRNAQGNEAPFWVNSFAYPYSMTYSAFTDALTSTPEYRSLIVRGLYPRIVHRNPDGGGLSYWTNWLANANSADLAGVLLASDENWARGGSTAEGWLTLLYQDVLGHAPDAGGLAYWVGELNSGRYGRRGIATAFWQSYENRITRVRDIYNWAFNRPIDQSGANYWAGQLVRHSDAWLASQVVMSQEAWSRAQVVYGGQPFKMPPPCPKPVPVWPPSPRVFSSLADYPQGGRLIALTFDDGPDPTWTPQILDILASRGVTATFFVVGQNVQSYPDLVRRELADGHHVASHTWSHPDLTRLSAGDVANQLASTTNLVNSIAGGSEVHCFRPPYGAHNATTDQIAAGQGLSTVLWSRDSNDWARPGVPAILANALSTTYDGGRGVNLMHDGGGNRSQTVAALGSYIDTLRAQGYQFVTIC